MRGPPIDARRLHLCRQCRASRSLLCRDGFPAASSRLDRSRSNIPGTEFIVLRAPSSYILGERPHSFGETAWDKPQVTGLRLSLDGQQTSGTLHVQCLLRGFSDTALAEVFAEISRNIRAGTTDLELMLEHPAVLDPGFSR